MRKILQTEWDGGIKRRWSHLKILSAPNNPTESISTVFSNLSHFQWRNQVRNSFYFFQKQCVSSLIMFFCISVDLESTEGLSSLCLSLLETLSDRQLQIKHQRATNRELADRLARLQDKLSQVEGGEILVCPSQVIMNNYRPSTDTEEVAIPEEELQRRLSRAGNREKLTGEPTKDSEKNETNVTVAAENSHNEESCEEVERPDTPQYEELQQRFENLLSILGSRQNSVDVDDNVFQDQPQPPPTCSSSSSSSSSPIGVVHYTCAKPPDILDFTRPSLPDIELEEEVAITIDGIQIVQDQTEEEVDVELPDHIQAMVNKAMKDIQ